jgi:uncharacterized protein
VNPEIVDIAVFAKAPEPGLAKTRLIPALGAQGAARLQRQLTRRAVLTAQRAALGSVTLWCTPHTQHRFFRALRRCTGVACARQPSGDLGHRMLHAFRAQCGRGPLLLIGTDCPALTPDDLRSAAQALRDGDDAVFLPAEDGGYVLVGLRRPQPAVFDGVSWGTEWVMAETRTRLCAERLHWCEPRVLWDVDRPADLPRLDALWRDEQRQSAIDATHGRGLIRPDHDCQPRATRPAGGRLGLGS